MTSYTNKCYDDSKYRRLIEDTYVTDDREVQLRTSLYAEASLFSL